LQLFGAQPERPRGGPDGGMDGRLTDEHGRTTILSVKGGKPHVNHVRELLGVLTREKGFLGALVELYEPTKAMRTDAAGAGVYATPTGPVPRLQILTIAQILEGRRIVYPPVDVPVVKPPRGADPAKNQYSLPLMTRLPGGEEGAARNAGGYRGSSLAVDPAPHRREGGRSQTLGPAPARLVTARARRKKRAPTGCG